MFVRLYCQCWCRLVRIEVDSSLGMGMKKVGRGFLSQGWLVDV